MITALSIITPEQGKGIKRLINSLRANKISVELRRARGVCVKHITYTSYNGKINIGKIDKYIGTQRNRLLCAEEYGFPKESGYKRFYSPKFASRLCTNMALKILEKCKNSENITLGLYDPEGSLHGYLARVLEFCCEVYVITDCTEGYRAELDAVMDEFGATAVITKQREELGRCDFIIAPDEIAENLPVREDALVLAARSPKVGTKGLVFSKYYFKMPNGFDKIKPPELSEDYFCSALYTLGSQYELGSIVPTMCSNGSSSQTVQSICAYLERFA